MRYATIEVARSRDFRCSNSFRAMTQKINRDKQFNGIVNTLNQLIVGQISLNQNFSWHREVNTLFKKTSRERIFFIHLCNENFVKVCFIIHHATCLRRRHHSENRLDWWYGNRQIHHTASWLARRRGTSMQSYFARCWTYLSHQGTRPWLIWHSESSSRQALVAQRHGSQTRISVYFGGSRFNCVLSITRKIFESLNILFKTKSILWILNSLTQRKELKRN